MPALTHVAIAVCCALSLSACLLFPPAAPQDLTLVAVQRVEVSTLPPAVQQDLKKYRFSFQAPHLLEITFTSQRDLDAYRQHWGDAYVIAVACHDWARRKAYENRTDVRGDDLGPPLMSLTRSVFQDHRNVLSPWSLSPEAPRTGRHAPPFPYRFYLAISREYPQPPLGRPWSSDLRAWNYDLRAQPVAVCFQISTTEMFRPSARTNVVEIPAEAIRAALAALP